MYLKGEKMANRTQRFLFNLSTISPIAFFFSVVWWIQYGSNELTIEAGRIHLTIKAIAISAIGLLGLVYAFHSVLIVKVSKRKLEIVPISVSTVKSKDTLSICAIITYILPFSNLVLADYSILLTISIIGVALVFLLLSNAVWPNPVLMLWGFHFYEISNVNGSEELPMISTRKSIQDAKTIKKVNTIWDYFVIEVRK